MLSSSRPCNKDFPPSPLTHHSLYAPCFVAILPRQHGALLACPHRFSSVPPSSFASQMVQTGPAPVAGVPVAGVPVAAPGVAARESVVPVAAGFVVEIRAAFDPVETAGAAVPASVFSPQPIRLAAAPREIAGRAVTHSFLGAAAATAAAAAASAAGLLEAAAYLARIVLAPMDVQRVGGKPLGAQRQKNPAARGHFYGLDPSPPADHHQS